MPKEKRLPRDQHPGFGTELRALIASGRSEDERRAGIIISETDELARCKAIGQAHPKEDRLEGPLKEISYLRIYKQDFSLRVYFVVIDGTIWMLGLDANKRRAELTDGRQRTLRERLKHIQQKT